MKDAGYEYVVIDDCLQVSRDAAGNIIADAKTFPSASRLSPTTFIPRLEVWHLFRCRHHDLRQASRQPRS